jgi:hypothetical protein
LYQLRKGSGGSAVFPGKHLFEFTLGWVMLFSPVMVVAGSAWLWRGWRTEGLRDDAPALLLAMWITPVAFFSLAMIPGSFPDPKYVNEGFLTFFMLIGKEIEQRWSTRRSFILKIYVGSAAITAVLLALFAWHAYRPFLALSPGGDPTRQIVGWHETGQQVTDLLHEKGISEPEYVLSFYYPLAAQFSMHLPSRPYTYSLQRELRNEWADKAKISPSNSIIVCEHDECDWLKVIIPQRFGHKIEEVGTIQTVLWGSLRRTIGVYHMVP